MWSQHFTFLPECWVFTSSLPHPLCIVWCQLSWWAWGGSQVWVWSELPWWLMLLSIFAWAKEPFKCLSWWTYKLLPIFNWVVFYLVQRILYIFCIQLLYQMYDFQIFFPRLQIFFPFLNFFRPCCVAYGIWDLSSPTRGQTRAPCIGSLNHWTTREVPSFQFLKRVFWNAKIFIADKMQFSSFPVYRLCF